MAGAESKGSTHPGPGYRIREAWLGHLAHCSPTVTRPVLWGWLCLTAGNPHTGLLRPAPQPHRFYEVAEARQSHGLLQASCSFNQTDRSLLFPVLPEPSKPCTGLAVLVCLRLTRGLGGWGEESLTGQGKGRSRDHSRGQDLRETLLHRRAGYTRTSGKYSEANRW